AMILFRQPGTIEKLVGHALKRRKHYDDPFPPGFLKNDPGDVPNTTGCGKRRATKLKDFHSPVKVYGTTPRQTQTSTQLSSIPQPRIAAFAPEYQGYPATRWADAADLSAVANCIRYRDTIVRGRVPFPKAVPCAWLAWTIQLLRMCGKAPFPCRDWPPRPAWPC